MLCSINFKSFSNLRFCLKIIFISHYHRHLGTPRTKRILVIIPGQAIVKYNWLSGKRREFDWSRSFLVDKPIWPLLAHMAANFFGRSENDKVDFQIQIGHNLLHQLTALLMHKNTRLMHIGN